MSASTKTDSNFDRLLSLFRMSVNDIDEALISTLEDVDYDQLSIEDKIRYDLFLAYSLNGLLWMYLRSEGNDPSQTVIKTELSRVKDLMSELQWAVDRKTIMPRVDKNAAKRFVKHGLWQPKSSAEPALAVTKRNQT